jgi:hypothetical protein
MKRPACHHDFLAASRHLTLANSLAVIQGALLADAIAITRSVQHDVNVQMIGVRRIRARTKHGREPSACGRPHRVKRFASFHLRQALWE